jgi:hypothetical protein
LQAKALNRKRREGLREAGKEMLVKQSELAKLKLAKKGLANTPDLKCSRRAGARIPTSSAAFAWQAETFDEVKRT